MKVNQRISKAIRKGSSLSLFTLVAAFLVLPLFAFQVPADTGGEKGKTHAPITWSPDRQLSWDDFKGKIPSKSRMDALTESGLEYKWDCFSGSFNMEVVARFDPNSSWVKSDPSPLLLRHEQGHFDITEIHARIMRQTFAELRSACRYNNDQIRKVAGWIIDEWNTAQADYDNETNHGRDHSVQSDWEQRIESELERLADWTD